MAANKRTNCIFHWKTCINGNMFWKVVNKIEINENGYNINFTDGSWHLFHELNIYDPTNIIKNNLYPCINKEKKGIEQFY